MSPKASRPILEMKVTLAPTRAAATDWFDPLPPGPILKPEPTMVSPSFGCRPARNARSATKTPRMATPSCAAIRLLLRRDHALGEDEAAVEARLGGGDDAIGLLGMLIERHALDRAHRPGLAFGLVDLRLYFLLHRLDVLGVPDHLHAVARMLDEAVERHHRQDGAGRARTGGVDAQQLLVYCLAGDGVGGKVGVAQHQRVAMAHGAQRMEHVRIQQRVEILQQGLPPLIFVPPILAIRRTESRYSSPARHGATGLALRPPPGRSSRSRGHGRPGCA